jgi:hypothetical protein
MCLSKLLLALFIPCCLHLAALPKLVFGWNFGLSTKVENPALGGQDRIGPGHTRLPSYVHMLLPSFFPVCMVTWENSLRSPCSPGFIFIGHFHSLVSSLWALSFMHNSNGSLVQLSLFYRKRWHTICNFSFSCASFQSSHELNHFISFLIFF